MYGNSDLICQMICLILAKCKKKKKVNFPLILKHIKVLKYINYKINNFVICLFILSCKNNNKMFIGV